MNPVWDRVSKTANCWLWTSTINVHGYGVFWNGSKLLLAHRYIYELEHGSIPPKMVVDHICRIRHCVNPDHLEIVTNGTNVLRGISMSAVNARKKFCIHGHEFSPQNTRIDRRGWRNCRTCDNNKKRRQRLRRRELAKNA